MFIPRAERTPAGIAARWDELNRLTHLQRYGSAFEQTDRYLRAIPDETTPHA
ncbi:hypothetical protein GV794_05195 [Nocardia cyriacigeorgica]|uniref:Uncharacterized protein n=1 Tax=Nocardia cyriacigeorgica TaxID=135487 RepID=A0A6P1CYP6_9NOCA|nr:hypothetical protein [Nocardia cyriacigeorgica]NEW37652.1 hypothetical protein [Nocardia cyriacigeorgica]NEW43245.1 hypothetical protein [Nocardia cyriacigeorgica]NEW48960.1 hypothetical protein [Nocardia cyriacigeorgica]NEW55061.1 hypothetical protein [Nocardia cyriacigeorgica]